MNPTDIAAYIGAAAWLPQISFWLYESFAIPKVRILPNSEVEIGFTALGPIFNLRMDLATEVKDCIIDKFYVHLHHESGEVRKLSWTGIVEYLSSIRNIDGEHQFVEKEDAAIAIKLTTSNLVEKFIRFQDMDFHDNRQRLYNDLSAHYNYLVNTDRESSYKILESRQYFDFIDNSRRYFWWKPGKYTIDFEIRSPSKIKLVKTQYHFTLAQYDVDAMNLNIDVMKTVFENLFKSVQEGYESKPVIWTWRNIRIEEIKKIIN